jgi:hypothetical protein
MSPKEQNYKNNAMAARGQGSGSSDDDSAQVFGGGGIMEGGDYGGAGRSPLMEIRVFAPMPQPSMAAGNDSKAGKFAGSGTAEGGDYGGGGGTAPILEITVYAPSVGASSGVLRPKAIEAGPVVVGKPGTQL